VAAFSQSEYAVGVGESARELPVAIGQTLQIGPVPCTIVGVAPPGFTGLADEGTPVAYIPATLYGYTGSSARGQVDYHTTYRWGWLELLVRRKPGVSIAAASADLTNAYRLSWEAERAISPNAHVDSGRPRAAAGSVVRERGPNASPVSKVALWIAGVAAIVLLIACANVAAIVSEGMAQAVWPGQDAVGKCIKEPPTRSAPCRTVIGVAENIRQNSLTESQTLQWYVPIEQQRPNNSDLRKRASSCALAVMPPYTRSA
jgi:hypothetical protein